MSNLRETRNCIAYAYRKGFINDREFVLLYDANRSKNPDFPYWNYERFELDKLTNAECNAEFRFYKNDIYKLADALLLPDEFVMYNSLIVESIPALCTLKDFHILAGIVIWFFTLQDQSQRSALTGFIIDGITS